MADDIAYVIHNSLCAKSFRAHPATVFSYLRRVFFLVLLPLLRGIASALSGSDPAFLFRGLLSLSILLLLVFSSSLLWRRLRLCVTQESLILTGGLWRQNVTVPLDKAYTVSFLTHFSLLPFKAVRFRVDIPGGRRKGDLSVLLWRHDADEIKRLLLCDPVKPEPVRVKEIQKSGMTWCADCVQLQAAADCVQLQAAADCVQLQAAATTYKPTAGKIAALSLLTSNSFGGILYMSVFVSQSGNILGGEFSDALAGVFDTAAHMFEVFLPPLAAALTVLLLAGWAVGFMRLFLRYSGFRFVRRDGRLTVCGGVFSRHERHLLSKDILFADFRQSLATKLLRLYSLYICAGGFGEKKNDYSCVILTEKHPGFEKHRAALLPEYSPAAREIKPDKRCLFRFVWAPAAFLAANPFVYGLLIKLFGDFSGFFVFVSVMAAVLTLWYLGVNIADFLTAGVAFDGSRYTLRYSAGFSLHTVVVQKENAGLFEISRSLPQRLGPYCDLILRTRAGRRAHRCRSLKKDEVVRLLNLL